MIDRQKMVLVTFGVENHEPALGRLLTGSHAGFRHHVDPPYSCSWTADTFDRPF